MKQEITGILRQVMAYRLILLLTIPTVSLGQIDVTTDNSIAIGTDNSSGYKVNVVNSSKQSTLRLETLHNSQSNSQYGLWNKINSPSYGHKYGISTIVYQNDDGYSNLHRGISVTMNLNGNSLSGHYNAGLTSIVNTSSTTSGTIYGLTSVMKGTGNVNRTGMHVINDAQGTGKHRGLKIETWQSGGTGLTRGIDIQTYLYGTNQGDASINTGLYNLIKLNSSSSGTRAGIYNQLEAAGSGERKGIVSKCYVHKDNTSEGIGIENLLSRVDKTGKLKGIYNVVGNWGNVQNNGEYTYGIYNVTSSDVSPAYGVYSVTYPTQSDFPSGFFEGDLVYTEDLVDLSDQRLKENVNDLSSGLDLLLQLRPVTYELIEDTRNENQFGFIAQEVQVTIPDIVQEVIRPGKVIFDSDGQTIIGQEPGQKYLGMSYSELIPILTKAIQEQQVIIELLEQRISELEN